MTRIAWPDDGDDFNATAHLTRNDPTYDDRMFRQTVCGTWTDDYSTNLKASGLVTCVACRASAGSHESTAGLVLVIDDGIQHRAVVLAHVTTHKDAITNVTETGVMRLCDMDMAAWPLEQAVPGAVNCLACLAAQRTT